MSDRACPCTLGATRQRSDSSKEVGERERNKRRSRRESDGELRLHQRRECATPPLHGLGRVGGAERGKVLCPGGRHGGVAFLHCAHKSKSRVPGGVPRGRSPLDFAPASLCGGSWRTSVLHLLSKEVAHVPSLSHPPPFEKKEFDKRRRWYWFAMLGGCAFKAWEAVLVCDAWRVRAVDFAIDALYEAMGISWSTHSTFCHTAIWHSIGKTSHSFSYKPIACSSPPHQTSPFFTLGCDRAPNAGLQKVADIRSVAARFQALDTARRLQSCVTPTTSSSHTRAAIEACQSSVSRMNISQSDIS